VGEETILPWLWGARWVPLQKTERARTKREREGLTPQSGSHVLLQIKVGTQSALRERRGKRRRTILRARE